MTWTVRAIGEAEKWLRSLDKDSYIRVSSIIELLRTQGPNLGTPYVKPIVASQHKNMKELRVIYGAQCFRILFAFDRKRQAILLTAGDKADIGWEEFYKQKIPIADAAFSAHLDEARKQEEKEKIRQNPGKPAKQKNGGRRK